MKNNGGLGGMDGLGGAASNKSTDHLPIASEFRRSALGLPAFPGEERAGLIEHAQPNPGMGRGGGGGGGGRGNALSPYRDNHYGPREVGPGGGTLPAGAMNEQPPYYDGEFNKEEGGGPEYDMAESHRQTSWDTAESVSPPRGTAGRGEDLQERQQQQQQLQLQQQQQQQQWGRPLHPDRSRPT